MLPHHHVNGILTPTKEASSPHIGGLGNYVPFKVRNLTCGYVNKQLICDKPQTSFSVTAPVGGITIHMLSRSYISPTATYLSFYISNTRVRFRKNIQYALGKDITLKVHLVGTPYATLGQQVWCTVIVLFLRLTVFPPPLVHMFCNSR